MRKVWKIESRTLNHRFHTFIKQSTSLMKLCGSFSSDLAKENEILRREVEWYRSTPPVLCLGKFSPSSYDTTIIATEFDEFMDQQGLIVDPERRHDSEWKNLSHYYVHDGRIEVRDPASFVDDRYNISRGWHRDILGKSYRMVTWANESPADFAIPLPGHCGHRILRFQPFDVVLWHNVLAKHRSPRKFNGHTRWIIRALDVRIKESIHGR